MKGRAKTWWGQTRPIVRQPLTATKKKSAEISSGVRGGGPEAPAVHFSGKPRANKTIFGASVFLKIRARHRIKSTNRFTRTQLLLYLNRRSGVVGRTLDHKNKQKSMFHLVGNLFRKILPFPDGRTHALRPLEVSVK